MTQLRGHLVCARCKKPHPRHEFVGKGRTCEACRLRLTRFDHRSGKGRPLNHPDYAVDSAAWMRFLTLKLPSPET